MADKNYWKREVEDEDINAASEYLSLVLPPNNARQVVSALRVAEVVDRKAKDIIRASGLPALGEDAAHVHREITNINSGKKLSPVLLVRGSAYLSIPAVIADGYHRLCAAYELDEDVEVPCAVVGIPEFDRWSDVAG